MANVDYAFEASGPVAFLCEFKDAEITIIALDLVAEVSDAGASQFLGVLVIYGPADLLVSITCIVAGVAFAFSFAFAFGF